MRKLFLYLFLLGAVAACRKSDPEPIATVQTEGIVIKYDQTRQLEVKLGKQVLDPQSFNWKIDDKTVGSIDNSGLFVAQKVGQATISIYNPDGTFVSKSVITVSPYSTLFDEPLTSWGTPLLSIIKEEKRKLTDRQTYRLQFAGENSNVRAVAYELDTLQGLGFSILQLTDSPAVRKEVMTFLGGGRMSVGSLRKLLGRR